VVLSLAPDLVVSREFLAMMVFLLAKRIRQLTPDLAHGRNATRN
jgi:hypothetical protein